MSSNQHANAHSDHHDSPKMYIIGYILSVILTIIPMLLVFGHTLARTPLIIISLVAATLQIFVQLFFFMHVNEGEKPAYHVMALILGAVFAITIIAGSVWIMSFNAQVQ
jgi:cytochrome o ubiquinol oxidase operon protein cyoD